MSNEEFLDLKKEIQSMKGDFQDHRKEVRNILLGNGKIGMFSKVEIMWKGGVFIITLIIIQTAAILFNSIK